jgi:hypothetical protein
LGISIGDMNGIESYEIMGMSEGVFGGIYITNPSCWKDVENLKIL